VNLKKFFRFLPVGILSHWLFQSILYMDNTERLLRLLLELILCAFIFLTMNLFDLKVNFFVLILISHTLMFLINGQIFVVLKNASISMHGRDQKINYTINLLDKAKRVRAIKSIYICGSMVRGQFNDGSDIDIRVLRHPGLINAICSFIFVFKERFLANVNFIPLDIYIIDSVNHLSKLRKDEKAKEANELHLETI